MNNQRNSQRDSHRISILDNLYQQILGRPVDQSGINTYINNIYKTNGIQYITKQLMRSTEYMDKKNNFNSMTGDRTSYINDTNSDINKSPLNKIFTEIIRELILIDNKSYNEEALAARIETVKLSLTHIHKQNISLTVFPHRENNFNTEYFNNSIKNIDNFKYWVYFLCLSNLWKSFYKKTVSTCGTDLFVTKLTNLKKIDFHTVFSSIQDDILDYLSIKMIGRLLDKKEKLKSVSFILENNSSGMIDYILSLNYEYNAEMDLAVGNIKKLKHKPKLLVMIAYLETQNRYFIQRMLDNVFKLQQYNPLVDIDFALDNERIDKKPTDYTPWSRVKRIRNLMIDKYPIHNYDYLYIIDSDIIDYPLNFPTRAIGLNPSGITAPMALIQNSTVFYDWCGYQKLGATSIHSEYRRFIMDKGCKQRNFALSPPYVDDSSRLVEIDCVGCTYIVPTSVFSQTYGNLQNELIEVFKLAKVTDHKIAENIIQYEDHPTFTDHYTICAAVRANGGKIYMDRGSAAYHADLPIHGEAWH